MRLNHSAASPYRPQGHGLRGRARARWADRDGPDQPARLAGRSSGVKPAVEGAGAGARRRHGALRQPGDLRVPGQPRRCAAAVPAAGTRRAGAALREQALADGILDASVPRRREAGFPPDEGRSAFIARQREAVARAVDVLEAEAASFGELRTIGEIAVGCALGYLDFRFAAEPWRPGHEGWRRGSRGSRSCRRWRGPCPWDEGWGEGSAGSQLRREQQRERAGEEGGAGGGRRAPCRGRPGRRGGRTARARGRRSRWCRCRTRRRRAPRGPAAPAPAPCRRARRRCRST